MTKPTLTVDDLDRQELLALFARGLVLAPRSSDLWSVRAARLHDKATVALERFGKAAEEAVTLNARVMAAPSARKRLAAEQALLAADDRRSRAWREYRRLDDASGAAWGAAMQHHDGECR